MDGLMDVCAGVIDTCRIDCNVSIVEYTIIQQYSRMKHGIKSYYMAQCHIMSYIIQYYIINVMVYYGILSYVKYYVILFYIIFWIFCFLLWIIISCHIISCHIMSYKVITKIHCRLI